MFTNRLFKSSRFWNAVIASIFAIVGFYISESELIAAGIFSLFGLKQFADGAEKFVKANKGVTYNKETGRDEYIPINNVKED